MKIFSNRSSLFHLGLLVLVLLPLNHYASAFLSVNNVEVLNIDNKSISEEVLSHVNQSESLSVDISKVSKIVEVVVTAYSSTPDQTDSTPFITANGSHVYDGTLAANFLPFGTKVRFPDYSGDKIYTVEDRMNRRFSDRADIWFKTRREALVFGKRMLKMEIIQ